MIENLYPPLNKDHPSAPDALLENQPGDRISVGNPEHTVAAIGRGASIIYHQALSAADNARAAEDFEHEKLARAVSRIIQTLYDQMRKAQPAANSPYKYLLPYEFNDAWRFFGRDDFREEVLSTLRSADLGCRLMVLHGDAGIGKTSLLRASISPALVAEGHLPLLVRVKQEPVSTSIKRALLQNLAPLEGLQKAPLCEFLHQVQELLPEGKQVYVLLDQFEEFLNLPLPEREHFTAELADCLFSEPPAAHWMISIQSAKVGYLSTLAPMIPQPLANTLVLPPLTTGQAREAVLRSAAMAGLPVEEPLVDALLGDLGGDAIDPSELQLVCHTLAQSGKPGERSLNFQAYQKAGRAEAILRDHLTLVLQQNLPPEDTETAWRALTIIAAYPHGAAPEVVIAELLSYHTPREKSLRVLEMLEINRLIRLRERTYLLTSKSLREPIRKWASRQAALEQAQIEARRQIEQVSNSALRGLFGGGGAFALAFLLTYSPQVVDWQVMLLTALYDALVGGIFGFLFLFTMDIARASFQGRRAWMQVLLGSLAGAVFFAGAFFWHTLLQSPSGEKMLGSILEGGIWGLTTGAGTALVLLAPRPFWQTVPVFSVLSALALWAGEAIGGAFHRSRAGEGADIGLWLLLAGVGMYLVLAGAAVWTRRQPAGGRASL